MKLFFVGVDISKKKLDICVRDAKTIIQECTFPNSQKPLLKSIKSLINRLNCNLNEVLFCGEYTGMYIYPLVQSCKILGLDLWIEDPTQIKYSFGVQRGKNDKVDASRISEYAFRYQDKAKMFALNDDDLNSLKLLLSERDLLLVDKIKYSAQLSDQENYMSGKDFKDKSKRIKQLVVEFNRLLNEIDSKIESIFEQNEKLSSQRDLLCSVDGVGKRIAYEMIALTYGFKRFQNHKQFCCYAGLAPFQYTSGSSIYSKKKVSQRANKKIKSLLHLAAISVIRYDGEMRSYYLRKKDEGKNGMLILNAIRAKIVARIFAVVTRNERFHKDYLNPSFNIAG